MSQRETESFTPSKCPGEKLNEGLFSFFNSYVLFRHGNISIGDGKPLVKTTHVAVSNFADQIIITRIMINLLFFIYTYSWIIQKKTTFFTGVLLELQELCHHISMEGRISRRLTQPALELTSHLARRYFVLLLCVRNRHGLLPISILLIEVKGPN